MSIEGVWKLEILGPYGWERLSTVFLENGRYHGASADHYSIGNYVEDDGAVKAQVRISQYGKTRTVFGGKNKQIDTLMEGNIKKSGKIVGTFRPSEGKKTAIKVRLTRLGGLD